MNIFEFLKLPANHRTEKKVTQLVKHFDEVVEKHKTGKTFLGQIKKDGVCALTVVIDGMHRIFSRTGKEFTNTAPLILRIKELRLPNGVYMGEMWMPKSLASLEQVSGATNPNRVYPLDDDAKHIPGNLDMAFFDLITLDEFVAGNSKLAYTTRHMGLFNVMQHRNISNAAGIEVLGYHLLETPDQMEHYLQEAIDKGEEGIVIRDPRANWEAGHKGYRVMKKVRGVDYDLKCIGWEEGEGKYEGKVANLLFSWKGGKTIKAMLGKGWTHEMAEQMYYDIIVGNSRLSPIGKIFQVYALEESSKGKLRLVKVGEQRHDKTESDL